jgi:hypothetical protein
MFDEVQRRAGAVIPIDDGLDSVLGGVRGDAVA